MFVSYKNTQSNIISSDKWGTNMLKLQEVSQCNYGVTGSETYGSSLKQKA
jgi:hypothetical protein